MTTAQLALGLLAFTLALYSLAARDQRSPYVTSAAYGITFAVLLGGLLAFIASSWVPPSWRIAQVVIGRVAECFLAYGAVRILYATIYLRNRRVNLRDDHLWSNFRFVRWAKLMVHRISPKQTYNHDPEPWPDKLLEALRTLQIPGIAGALDRLGTEATLEIARSPTLTMAVNSTNVFATDAFLLPLAAAFVRADCLVQYMSCARHPVHFIGSLRRHLAKDLDVGNRLRAVTAIDAYTPHFGFTDSVHDRMRQRIIEWKMNVLESGPSYAGMHTASARAFNRAKDASEANQSKGVRRKPTLVIYEGARELVDLESPEQYRNFVRHVMPSERLWGGMLTVFVEYGADKADIDVLRTYADVYIPEPQKTE